jgi:hypothetical protein
MSSGQQEHGCDRGLFSVYLAEKGLPEVPENGQLSGFPRQQHVSTRLEQADAGLSGSRCTACLYPHAGALAQRGGRELEWSFGLSLASSANLRN